MDLIEYHKSLHMELNAVRNRVRQLMDDVHYLTDGELKESVLRSVLRRYLPNNISVGRGFIHNGRRCSKQIDILLYSSDHPVLFRDGDLVFVTPDAVKGIIEVKTNLNYTTINTAIEQLNEQANIIVNPNCFVGLFSYEYEGDYNTRLLERVCSNTRLRENNSKINHILIGELFFKYWKIDPSTHDPCSKWHAYRLEELSYAYFINNLIEWVSKNSFNQYSKLWFPLDSKEHHHYKIGEMNLIAATIDRAMEGDQDEE